MNKEIESLLIKPRKWPNRFLNTSKDHIAITRPEDLNGYSYANSIKPNQEVNFEKLDIPCSDITWDGWNYLLPLMQIKYFNNLPKDLEDYPMKFFWYLAEDGNLSKFLCLFDEDDLDRFKNWISFILFSGQDPFSFLLEDELLSILEKINSFSK